MARIARIVVPDLPHHITQRGNRRQDVFFSRGDYEFYLRSLSINAKKFELQIVLYCLMQNHIHLIAIPKDHNSLAQGLGATHCSYTRMINTKKDWNGYLWQGRFRSYVLDKRYLFTVTRYILLNPVRAKIVKKPEDYEWSSINHHLKRKKLHFINDEILQSMIDNWAAYLEEPIDDNQTKALKAHERTGRPLGEGSFINRVEKKLHISLRKIKPGPKGKK